MTEVKTTDYVSDARATQNLVYGVMGTVRGWASCTIHEILQKSINKYNHEHQCNLTTHLLVNLLWRQLSNELAQRERLDCHDVHILCSTVQYCRIVQKQNAKTISALLALFHISQSVY